MATEILSHDDRNFFVWKDDLDRNSYIFVSYTVYTSHDAEAAAIGIAKEQSCSTTRFFSHPPIEGINAFTARVVNVSVKNENLEPYIAPYYLNTPVYKSQTSREMIQELEITIAYPRAIFESGMTRIWNVVFGEIARLGYLTGFRCNDISFPEDLLARFPGPRFGVKGIREKLRVFDRPLFCRSMRPAVGLATKEMIAINRTVLTGGFDIVKDDELTYDTDCSEFLGRIRKMVDMKKSVEDATGEKKMYVANIIDDHSRSFRYAELAAKAGVDALLVSVHLQGMSIISEVSNISGLPVLSHNACGDILTRLPFWGVSDELMIKIQRMMGADFVVTPGEFSTPYIAHEKTRRVISACRNDEVPYRAVLPILQGGKVSSQLYDYFESVGSADFMLIVAAAVDNAPQGQFAGAKAFREAWENECGYAKRQSACS
ncbi:MAG: RuBisCO large subunit C-terminal-like domain-containing protein [Syntrophotaleaceae bacterium]